MESKKTAFLILLLLVSTAVGIFALEKKFLLVENRGSTLSHYETVEGFDRISLLIEDFEGLSRPDSVLQGDSILKLNGFFSYGSAKMSMDHSLMDHDPMASMSALCIEWKGPDKFGGWGKGVGANIELDPLTDFVNFRIYFPEVNLKEEKLRISFSEDDNENALLETDQDDSWFSIVNIQPKNEWQLISIPLKDFIDENKGGDHELNVTRKGGIHTLIFSFDKADNFAEGQKWYFDFISISDGKLIEDTSMN